ncbi:MAG: hypothetical protein HRU25_17145 [Psychrobium sp.]|nr:hypothetical protein [Psychrobium sp.]
MSFDLESLLSLSVEKFEELSLVYKGETIYGVVINADSIYVNSVEQFERTIQEYSQWWEREHRHIDSWASLTEIDFDERIELSDVEMELISSNEQAKLLNEMNKERAEYREGGNPYLGERGRERVKKNVGDWPNGFGLPYESGFDDEAYGYHYELSDESQKSSEYGLAMDQLVIEIKKSGVLDKFKKTSDFYITRVEHNY